MLCRT